jgi:hypothetical protein
MTIKNTLREYMTPKSPTYSGTVSAVTPTTIGVKSKLGRRDFQVANPSQYRVGDPVKFQGNSFLGRLPAVSEIKTYSV